MARKKNKKKSNVVVEEKVSIGSLILNALNSARNTNRQHDILTGYLCHSTDNILDGKDSKRPDKNPFRFAQVEDKLKLQAVESYFETKKLYLELSEVENSKVSQAKFSDLLWVIKVHLLSSSCRPPAGEREFIEKEYKKLGEYNWQDKSIKNWTLKDASSAQ